MSAAAVAENLVRVVDGGRQEMSTMHPIQAYRVVRRLLMDAARALAPISTMKGIRASMADATKNEDNVFLVMALLDKANSYSPAEPWRKLAYLEAALNVSAMPKSVLGMTPAELTKLGVGRRTSRFAYMIAERERERNTSF
jgi:hypothetical protein